MKTLIKKTLWGILGLVMMGGLLSAGGSKAEAEEVSLTSSPTAPVSPSPEIVKSGEYVYEVISKVSKTATLRKIYSDTSEVVIPSVIDGYSIVQIGTYDIPYIRTDNVVSIDYDKATIFSEKDSAVKKLVIPEGVTTIL